LLIVLTVISWWSGAGHGLGSDAHSLATALVLVIAFAKVHLVGMHFMELRRAALPLRLVFDTWVVIVPMALIGLYHWA
jgi:hypothetical protein